MSPILNATVSELYVTSPTIINVRQWLDIHHTVVSKDDSLNDHDYHIFAVAEVPTFDYTHQYIDATVGISLGPIILEFAGKIGADHHGEVTLNIKYPFIPSIKVGSYQGELHQGAGMTMSLGVAEVHGRVRLWIPLDDPAPSAWAEFDLTVFGDQYKGKFSVLPIPPWFIAPQTQAPDGTPSGKGSAPAA